MNNNINKSEKIIRDKLEEFSTAPPDRIWVGVKKGVRMKKLIRFQFIAGSKIATLITLTSLVLMISLSIFLMRDNDKMNTKSIDLSLDVLSPEPNKNKTEHQHGKSEVANKIQQPSEKIKTENKIEEINREAASEIKTFSEDKSQKIDKDKEVEKKLITEVKNDLANESKETNEAIINKDLAEDSTEEHNDLSAPNQNGIDSSAITTTADLSNSDVSFPFQLRIWGGADVVSSGFSLWTVNEGVTYLNKRKAHESSVIYSSQGMDLIWKNSKNRILQTGINLTTIGENAEYTRLELSIDSVGYFIDTIIKFSWQYYFDSLHQKIDSFIRPYADTAGFVIYDSSSKTIKEQFRNRYTYVEIPLLIGFSTQFNKVEIGAMTGVSFGYLSGAEGKIPDPDTEGFLILHEAEAFLHRWTLNYLLRINVSYSLTSQLKVFAEPAFRYNLISVTNNQIPLKQRYYSTGVHIGLQYKF